MKRISIAQEYIDREGGDEGDVLVAALAFAVDLMRGDPATFKAGYDPASAIITTIEAFAVEDDGNFRRQTDRLVTIADDLAGARVDAALAVTA